MGIPNKLPLNKTICLIQLTRIGDILQTIQVALELKKEHPRTKLIFIGRSKFAKPLTFLISQVFDQYYFLNFDELMGETKERSLDCIRSHLSAFISKINQTPIDLAVNLSFSTSSSYLSSLINANCRVGLTRTKRGELSISDTWSQFVYSNVMGGANNPFNLIDIYKDIIGIKQNSYANCKHVNLDQKKIIIHPFASTAKKTWNHHKWIELIYCTLRDNPETTIKIVGSPDEAHRAKAYSTSPILSKYSDRIDNIVGKTTLEELYSEFTDARLFIGHDSMVSHMASLNHVQTITVSLGTVRPHETTPYGANNFNLAPKSKCFPCFPEDKCEFTGCHKDLSYQAINTIISAILTGKNIDNTFLKENCSPIHLENMSIYQSVINAESGLELIDISRNNSDTTAVFKELYRITWNFLLRGLEINGKMPELSTQTVRELLTYVDGVKNLYELNNFGTTYSNYILDETSAKTPNILRIKEYAQKIGEIDQLSIVLKRTFPLLAPVIDLYNVAKGNLQGENIIDLAKNSLVMYHESNNAVSVLFDLIENIVAKNQIKNKTVPSPHPTI